MKIEPGKNLGVLIKPRSRRDYILGSYSNILKEILREDRNYEEYLPILEYQSGKYGDTWGCVSFSALNCLEILFKCKYNIDLNFSDRFTVVLSGTKIGRGNYLTWVGDSIREKDGVIPEEMYPWDRVKETLEDYYNKDLITQEMYEEGLLFLNNHVINYQWVQAGADNFYEALKYGPIQVTVNTRAVEVNGIIQKINSDEVHHAITLFKAVKGEYFECYDQYEKSRKKYAWDFNFGTSLIYTLSKKNMKLVKTDSSSTIYLIDNQNNRRAFYDEIHFDSVAPVLGLAKLKEDNNGETDFSQVEIITEEEMNNYNLERPLFITSN